MEFAGTRILWHDWKARYILISDVYHPAILRAVAAKINSVHIPNQIWVVVLRVFVLVVG